MLRWGTPLIAGLHAAGAARFHRLPRRVQPHVAPLRQEVRDMQIVVVDERDPSAVGRIDRVAVNLLQVVLARVVGGMRFAREENLHVPARRDRMRIEPRRIAENQLGPLVAGEAAREADGERTRVEQRPGGDDRGGADVFLRPAIARALAG